jgi:hypothetical protein
MCLNENEDKLWRVLGALNALRNKIAHTQEMAEIQKTMNQLRKVYKSVLTPRQAQDMEKQPDHQVVESAAYLCAGFLVSIADDSKSQHQVIDKHWKPAA